MTQKELLTLAALATAAVAGLRVAALRPPQRLDRDWQQTGLVDEDGQRWVIIAPRNPLAEKELEAELKLLGHLANYRDAHRTSFEVPRPRGFVSVPQGGRALVYRDLPGDPVEITSLDERPLLAAELGRSLAALHEIPLNLLTQSGFQSFTSAQCRERLLEKLDQTATSGKIPPGLLSRWENALEEVAWWRFRPACVHGDMAPDSLRIAHERVVGMLGFGKAHGGDPARDLAWLVAEASEPVLERVFDAYHLAHEEGADPHLRVRAELYGELALVDWLAHGLSRQDPAVIEDATQLLGKLHDQVGDSSLGFSKATALSHAEAQCEPLAEPASSTGSPSTSHGIPQPSDTQTITN